MHVDLKPGPPATRVARPYVFPEVIRRGPLIAADLPGCPIGYAALLFDHGVLHEPAGKEGVLQLLFAAVREGGERLGRDELAFELEGMGATWSTTVGDDFVLVATVAPTAALVPAVRVIAETVRRPRLAADAVARIRDGQLSALAANWSKPGRRQEAALARVLYQSGRQAVPLRGTVASVGSITPGFLSEYHRHHIAGTGRLVLAGDLAGIDLDMVVEAGAALGGPMALGEAVAAGAPRSVPRPAVGRDFVVVDRPGAVGARIALAHHVPVDAASVHAPLTVACHVLGGTTHSRLARELRDRRGQVYEVSAGLQLTSRSGVFSVRTQTGTETAGEVVATVLQEIETLRRGGVTADEFEAARALLTGQFPIAYLTPQAVGIALGCLASLGGTDDFHSRKYRELASLDRTSVNEAAGNQLSSSDLTVVVEGEARPLLASLHSAGLGPVRTDDEGRA
ncbi:insulinase family protein [Kitasatospora acidiphila]|uniref:Insulinase family protein n=1 Tax=Kitasatospora acidiphila TaxID=2567942 RepID=A0A540W6S3_9ACTN|nr:pitrilysin family protein [Kitasatospora acidiphila]TQF04044.1 insulinase family protein [Kitasatospora acidiphila]